MKYKAINFREKFNLFDGHWAPRVVAEMNDNQFKLAKVQGEFSWHTHPDTDEVFIIIEGVLEIEFRDGKVRLEAGEMFVVPKGVEHKPAVEHECRIMLVEPKDTVNTGDTQSDLPARIKSKLF